MKNNLQRLLCTAMLATTSVSQMAFAESPLTGNVGVTSNYIWRGATQANDDSAVSGGIDYAHGSGLYAGIWVSSLGGDTDNSGAGQYEQDVYVGYGGDAGPLSYDVSYISYVYPVAKDVADFQEINLSLGYELVTLLIAPTLGKESEPGATGPSYEDDMYMSISAEFEIKKDLTLGIVYGTYDVDQSAADTASTSENKDYSHIQLSLSKGDFVFAYDKKDPDKDDGTSNADANRFSVTWSKSFDL